MTGESGVGGGSEGGAGVSGDATVQLWVRSDVLADGSYAVGISVGEDRAWTFEGTEAVVAYATACFAHATEAEHDSAVFTLLLTAGVPVSEIARLMLAELRPDRDDGQVATKPLRFTPAAGARGPFISVELEDRLLGQISPTDLRDHAGGVLTSLAACQLDTKLLRVLMDTVGLDEEPARGLVTTLAEHWPGR